jgi:hypothetical protein
MQKCSLLTFACCLFFLFTACEKETLLETNQDLSPKKNLTVTQSTAMLLTEVMGAGFDEDDSVSLFSLLNKPTKNTSFDVSSACFGPITGICGSAVVYNNCYYKYQIWNDPSNLYVDLYFPSSVIGWRTDCYGKRCQYYVSPCITLDLYNASGNKIGSVNLSSSNITTTEKRITYNINTLSAQYPGLKCVKLSGTFYVMKKCSNCSPVRVSTVCITPRQFCLQQCPSVCPTVSSINVDKLKFCGSGAVKGTVNISGDASKTQTTWTMDGQVYTGNTVSIDLPQNSLCNPVYKTIRAKVICTTDQSVLSEREFVVQVNPTLTAEVNVDNSFCLASIDLSCQSDLATISWAIGDETGTGNSVQVNYIPRTLNYTISADGCSYSGSANDLICLPLIKNNTSTGNR